MADGYVLIEINKEGEGRIKSPEGVPCVSYLDFRLEGCDFEDCEMAESMVESLPKELKDVLVLCSFLIRTEESFNGESTDYATEILLESHLVLKHQYQEFYRQMVASELRLKGSSPDCEDESYYSHLVSDYEEFYGVSLAPPPDQIRLI